MSETTQNAAPTTTKTPKAKPPRKATKANAVAPKEKAASPKPDKKPKPPRESREGWGTFALRLPVSERDAFHKAAGKAAASSAARAVLVAFANGDEAAFRSAVAQAKKLTA